MFWVQWRLASDTSLLTAYLPESLMLHKWHDDHICCATETQHCLLKVILRNNELIPESRMTKNEQPYALKIATFPQCFCAEVSCRSPMASLMMTALIRDPSSSNFEVSVEIWQTDKWKLSFYSPCDCNRHCNSQLSVILIKLSTHYMYGRGFYKNKIVCFKGLQAYWSTQCWG